ncbi:DUF370 domain-containing protein [Oscillospiraceae bacterium OttesenSCG-928-F05]|nr:DUF370 domain-containing protein [Oscillospiraceae bacterium OttesenSCG-928-F05]
MVLHLGGGVILREKTVVGIFDLDNTSVSKHTRKTLELSEKAGRVVSVGDDLPRSFIVAEEGGETIVYLSQISTATLLKRTEKPFDLSGDA